MVGPAALGEDVQNTVHYIIGVSQSNGWDHQLDNEPGVVLIFVRKWRAAPWSVVGFEVDVVPSLGGSVGNVLTQGSMGAILCLGDQLSVDYGPPHVRPSLTGLAAIEAVDGLAWYVFSGAEGRLVAHISSSTATVSPTAPTSTANSLSMISRLGWPWSLARPDSPSPMSFALVSSASSAVATASARSACQ